MSMGQKFSENRRFASQGMTTPGPRVLEPTRGPPENLFRLRILRMKIVELRLILSNSLRNLS